MDDCTLTQKHQNQITELFKKYRIDANQFEWIPIKYDKYSITGRHEYSSKCIELTHKEKSLYFYFYATKFDFRPEYRPGADALIKKIGAISWEDTLEHVEVWLQIVKEELDQPDLWAELVKTGPVGKLPILSDKPESHFTDDDVEQVRQQLNKAKEEIIERFNLNTEQIGCLSGQMEYLVNQAKKQSIRDWRNIMIGTLVTTAMNLAIPQDAIGEFWSIIRSALESIRYLIGV